jgi:cobalt-zinc-cadmium efflux system outer membrane protein
MNPRAALLVLGLTTGCATSSLATDIARVREASRVDALPDVATQPVDTGAADDVRAILAKPLDADAAVRLALLNNRELRATLRELGVARGRLVQAGLVPNPIVEAELVPERDTEIELRVEYHVTGAVLAPLRARATAPEVEAARYRTAAAVVRLGYRVREAYYRALAASQRVHVAHRMQDSQAAARDAARALFEAGNVRELDLAGQEAAYEKGRITVAQLELEALDAREELQKLLGLYGDTTAWRFAEELPEAGPLPPLPDALETAAIRANLDLRRSREELEGLARQAGVTRLDGWLPDVSVDVHGLHVTPEPGTRATDAREWRFGGGVTMTLPMFDRNQGATASLEAAFDAALERHLGLATDLRASARQARARVVSAHARARTYQEVIVPAQRRVSEQTLLQYNAMQIGVFQLLSARREALDVELAELETLREYWTAVAALQALLTGVQVDGSAATGAVGSVDATNDAGGD